MHSALYTPRPSQCTETDTRGGMTLSQLDILPSPAHPAPHPTAAPRKMEGAKTPPTCPDSLATAVVAILAATISLSTTGV